MIKNTTIILCSTLMLCFFACGKPQASRHNQALLASLRTATSTKNMKLIDDNLKLIETRHTSNEMSDEVYKQLKKIVDMAKARQWKEADKEAFAMMKSQKHSDPEHVHRHEDGKCSDHAH